MPTKRGFSRVPLALPKIGNVPLFTNAGVATTIRRLMDQATVFEGVKLLQAFEAIYNQGRKDGARATFERLDTSLQEVKQLIPHKNPGRVKKSPAPVPPQAPSGKRKRSRKKRRGRR
jgi:hypothetical protein